MTPNQIKLLLMMAEAVCASCADVNQELCGAIQDTAYKVDMEQKNPWEKQDPQSHAYDPNRKGLCKFTSGAGICHLPEDAQPHSNWANR